MSTPAPDLGLLDLPPRLVELRGQVRAFVDERVLPAEAAVEAAARALEP